MERIGGCNAPKTDLQFGTTRVDLVGAGFPGSPAGNWGEIGASDAKGKHGQEVEN